MDGINSTNTSSEEITDDPNLSSNHDDPSLQAIRTTVIFLNVILIITGNIINLIVLPKLKNTHESTKTFLVTLAIMDLATGIILAIFALPSSFLDRWPFGGVLCIIIGLLYTSTVGISLNVLFLMSLDRYVAITRPFRYIELVTQKRAIIAILFCVSLYPLNMYFLGTVETPLDNVVFNPARSMCLIDFGNPQIKVLSVTELCATVLFPILTIAMIYGRILLIARDAARKVARLQPSVNPANARGSSEEQNARGFSRNEWKATRTTLLVTGGFSVAWLPFIIGQIWEASTGNRLTPAADFITFILPGNNSWWNVFIYSFMNQQFRQTAKGIFGFKQGTDFN